MMNHLLNAFIATVVVGCGTKIISPTCEVGSNAQIAEVRSVQYYPRLQDAFDCSRTTGRPVLIAFLGYASQPTALCWVQLGRKEIQELITDRLVLCVLLVDDQQPITANDLDGFPQIKGNPTTIGQRNSMLESEFFSKQSQPLYALVDAGMTPLAKPLGYVAKAEADEIVDWVEDALDNMP